MSKGDDIHKAILARASQPAAARPVAAVGARPYVAEAGHRLAEGLREENQRLKAERANALLVLRLDPKRVRATKFINRDERSFLESDAKFISLKESIRAHGQDTPIRVRPVADDPAVDYEIVFGHRRHRACLALDAEIEGGFQVLALLDSTVSEARDFVLKMHRENEEREEQCAYDKGRSYAQWLAEGLFADQMDVAREVGISKASMSRYLQVARLPQEVVEAFGDPRGIALRWVEDLARVLNTDRAAVLSKGRELASKAESLPPEVVLRTLLSAGAGSRPRPKASRTETFKIGGRPAFSYGFDKGKVGEDGKVAKASQVKIRFGKMVAPAKAAEMAEALKELLQEKLGAEYGSGGNQ